MKSNIQLSWQSAAEIGGIVDLVVDNKSNSINSSGTIAERTWTELYWLKNLGRTIADIADPVAYNCGFYLDKLPSFDSLDISLPEILSWSSIIDPEDGLPCGVFTIFGFDELNVSYIEKYLGETITSEEMYLFSHNWNQGQSRIDQIPFEVARRYLNTATYIAEKNFEGIVETHTPNGFQERSGVLRVMVVIRVPQEITAKKLSFVHKIGYDEKA
jgi:hypothetical protein